MIKRFNRAAIVAALLLALPAAANAQIENLSVHGYLTQGFARSSQLPIFGMDTIGTTDYRAAALQFRYAISSSDAMVIQLSHRRLGAAAIQATEPAVDLDWVFFQTRWKGNSVRVGKVPMPRGLFNEVRDVGAIFPFFRASKAFYSEGVETIDGISVSRSFNLGGGFSVDAATYAGGYDVKVELVNQNGPYLVQNRMTRAAGGHLNINTPISGLRFSADQSWGKDKSDGALAIGTASVDLTRDRFFVRGEYLMAGSNDSGEDNTDYKAWYAQAGIGLTPKVWVNGQYEFNGLTLFNLLPTPFSYDNIKDLAGGISYKFSPMLVVKGEYHDFKGYQLDVVAPPLNPATGAPLPPKKNNYFIVSVSAAF